jgi:signal transduction histidine kinase
MPGRDEMALLGRSLDQMAESLTELHEKNEREAKQRLDALEQLRHADRLATVGKLAAGVAHELGTPLNVVTARAKMIARGSSKGDEAKDDARVIAEQGERITNIIRQLLDFARAHKPRRSPHDLSKICRKAGTLLEPLARKQGVIVRVEGDPIVASVDEGQLHQVIMNLIVNAVHAQPNGGVVRVIVDESEPGWARVRVEDDGPGIPDELRDRVFDPFFSTKDVGEGTGLGLSVSYGIVREHGGRLEVSRAPSKGACLTATFPISDV